jgi:hypothetical protein
MSDDAETAILAGGCFWGVQELLRHRDGVISTRVGYTGGENDNPTDEDPGVTPRRSRSSSTPSASPTGTSWSSSSRSTTRRPRTVRARRPAPTSAPRSSTRATSSAGSPRTRSQTSTPQASGPAGRYRDQRGQPLLGGRSRRPGLFPAPPGRRNLPLPAAGLEAATPRDRGLTQAKTDSRRHPSPIAALNDGQRWPSSMRVGPYRSGLRRSSMRPSRSRASNAG